MDASQIEALFTRETGDYVFARWGRPLAPIVFGVEDASLQIVKGAVEAVCVLAGHEMAETDPELGANFMWFFLREWDELTEVPKLDELIPDLGSLVTRLKAAGANQYRSFRFDDADAIQACFVFIRMDAEMEAVAADTLALSQAVQSIVLWSDLAFREASPLAVAGDTTVLRPDIADVIRAAYDPAMPAASRDTSHALRVAARVGQAAS